MVIEDANGWVYFFDLLEDRVVGNSDGALVGGLAGPKGELEDILSCLFSFRRCSIVCSGCLHACFVRVHIFRFWFAFVVRFGAKDRRSGGCLSG